MLLTIPANGRHTQAARTGNVQFSQHERSVDCSSAPVSILLIESYAAGGVHERRRDGHASTAKIWCSQVQQICKGKPKPWRGPSRQDALYSAKFRTRGRWAFR